MRLLSFVCLVALVSCAPSASTSSSQAAGLADPDATVDAGTTPPSSTTRYEDVEQYLLDGGDEAGFSSWLAVRDALKSSFDDVCGDTYCEGDYSNLEPIRLRCSVDTTSGVLKSCKYVFAGSYEDINAQTGSIKVTAKTFSCAITVTNVKLADFLSTLGAMGTTGAIQRPLPGSVRSVYDSLGSCL